MISVLWLQASTVCFILGLLWKYFRQVVLHSPLDNVPGPRSQSFLYGNLAQILDSNGWGMLEHLTNSYNGVVKLHGPLGHRMLYVFDPLAMHNIVIKDQHIFEETAAFIRSNTLTFGPGLLATLGDHHRKQRKMLNPVFSITHMRRMIPIFTAVGRRLRDAIELRVLPKSGSGPGPVEVDMLEWTTRSALELIGQAGLGYSFDPLVADTADEFADAIKLFQPNQMKTAFARRLLPYFPDVGSLAFRRAAMGLVPHEGVQSMKKLVDVMWRRATEIWQSKKLALEQGDEALAKQVGEGKDIMSILLRANMAASEEDKLPEEELIGQMSTLILAAMDTTSNALVMALSLLAQNPAVQDKLRTEVLEASKGTDLDYDTLISLPYLDAVFRETLRFHPPLSTAFRETRQNVVLPLSEPIKGVDGTMIHEISIPKDTTVAIGIRSSNRNKAIWGEDAAEWKPERWLSPLPQSVTEAKIPGVYSHLMTFLGGSRGCIGVKFAQLELSEWHQLVHKEEFTFAPSDQLVVWNLSPISYPSIGYGKKPALPIKVGQYRSTLGQCSG